MATFKKNYVSKKSFQFDFGLSSNPLGPSPDLLKTFFIQKEAISAYPDAGYPQLSEKLANFHRISPDQIILGAGLDGLIYDLINYLIKPDDELIIPEVTFQNAIFVAKMKKALIHQIPMMPNLSVDFSRVFQTLNNKTKGLCCAMPAFGRKRPDGRLI